MLDSNVGIRDNAPGMLTERGYKADPGRCNNGGGENGGRKPSCVSSRNLLVAPSNVTGASIGRDMCIPGSSSSDSEELTFSSSEESSISDGLAVVGDSYMDVGCS